MSFHLCEKIGDKVYALTQQAFLQFAPDRAKGIYELDDYDEEDDVDFDDVFKPIKRRTRITHRGGQD